MKASSSSGDIVLDPFCGCATTLVAVDRLDRRWVGIDVSPVAVDLVKNRFKAKKGLFYDIINRTDTPKRTDIGALPKYKLPREQDKAVWQTGWGLQRMWHSLQEAAPDSRPHHRAIKRWDRSHRESATALWQQQLCQGQARPSLSGGEASYLTFIFLIL